VSEGSRREKLGKELGRKRAEGHKGREKKRDKEKRVWGRLKLKQDQGPSEGKAYMSRLSKES